MKTITGFFFFCSFALHGFITLAISNLKEKPIKMNVQEHVFDEARYGFSVLKFIDGRLDKKKPTGSERSAWSFNTVLMYYNDSLEAEVTRTLSRKKSHFDPSVKIIVVLKQLYSQCYQTSIRHHGEERAVTLALDYYLSTGSSCTMVCQQYYKYIQNTKMQMGSTKNAPTAVSQALEQAFKEFDIKLRSNAHAPFPDVFDTISLYSRFRQQPQQVANALNLKDGLYFSGNDLYLNKPALIHSTLPDAEALSKGPVLLKANDYLTERVFAIVKNKQIFIYTNLDYYVEFFIDENGLLYSYVKTTFISPQAKLKASAGAAMASFLAGGGLIGGLVGSAVYAQMKADQAVQVDSYTELDFTTGYPVPDATQK